MKIKTQKLSYDKVINLPKYKRQKPLKPSMFFRTLLKIVGKSDLKETDFTFNKINMDLLNDDEPALFLMNHSSFIDLEIATSVLYPRPLNIVCTSDGFVGKEWLMRHLGCIPTKKFVADLNLIRDMSYALKTLKSSILMYPEASYSFDGTATPLPESIGKCIKMLGVPVVMIKTNGAFLRDPLYNMLQKRKVKVSADIEYLLSPEDIKQKSASQIMEILKDRFSFDNFRYQQQHKIEVTEDFRADGLDRVLYKCPICQAECTTVGKGTTLTCNNCKSSWELDKYGALFSNNGIESFTHIPDWFAWERKCVRDQLESGKYKLELPVTIRMMVDMKAIYEIGDGTLIHNGEGFTLTSDDGKLEYHHSPCASYSLYSDYFWYELGDVICIGNDDALYYCFPKTNSNIVAKARLAAEELYKIKKDQK